MSTEPTITKQLPLAQIQIQPSENASDNTVIMSLPCGGRTKSTRDILVLMRQQAQGFPRTAFIADNQFMELLKPLLKEVDKVKKDAKSNGTRMNWTQFTKSLQSAETAHNLRLQNNQDLLFLSPMPGYQVLYKSHFKLDGEKPMRQHKGAPDREIVTVENFVEYSNRWKAGQTIGDEGACHCHEFCDYIVANTTFGTEFLDICFEKCLACKPSKPKAKRPRHNVDALPSGRPMCGVDAVPGASSILEMPSSENTNRNAVEAKDATVTQTAYTTNTTTANSHNTTHNTSNNTTNNNNTNSNTGNHSQVFHQTNVYLSNSTPVSAAIQLARCKRKLEFLEKFILENGLAVPEFTDEGFPFQEGFHTPDGAYRDLDPPTSAADPAVFEYCSPAAIPAIFDGSSPLRHR